MARRSHCEYRKCRKPLGTRVAAPDLVVELGMLPDLAGVQRGSLSTHQETHLLSAFSGLELPACIPPDKYSTRNGVAVADLGVVGFRRTLSRLSPLYKTAVYYGKLTKLCFASFCWCHCSTRSSATVDRPHDALCQLKYCQLLHSCTKNPSSKGLQ